MSYASVLAKTKTKLESVTGIGIVHDYERHANDWATLLSLFTTGGKLNACTITRESCPESAGASRTNRRTHNIVIRLYYGLKDEDATEKTAQNLADAIIAVFRESPDFEADVIEAGPPFLRTFEHRMLGDVLCHYAEIVLETEEEEQWSP